MPVNKDLQFLKESIHQADDTAKHLTISTNRCKQFSTLSSFSENQLIDLEALMGRFARLSDLLIQKVLKTIERLDLDTPGTVRDRIINAEKKGLVSAESLLEIRDVRNTIAHDYEASSFFEIVQFVLQHTSYLIEVLEQIKKYSKKFY